MNPDRWRRIETIFQAACSREPDEQAAYLDAECGPDLAMRREIEELLAAHRGLPGILDEAPPISPTGIVDALRPTSVPTNLDDRAAPTLILRCPTCFASFDTNLRVCPEHGEALVADPEALLGTTVDGLYHIERILGTGGMGTVYLARHELLRDRVAIKVLPHYVGADPEWVARFLREGRAARAVHHPNLVTVHDLRSTGDGRLFMVQEYIEGRTLREELTERGRLPEIEVLEVVECVAGALDAAHAAGVVHRDVKPENVILSAAEDARAAKLLDLGITKLRRMEDSSRGQVTNPTLPGQQMGTPAYMAPEQWGEASSDGVEEIDGRADVYSLGVVAYEMATGKQPFTGRTALEIWRAHVESDPRPARDVVPEISEEFSRAIARAMARDRMDRPESAGAFAHELRAALESASPSRVSTASARTLRSPAAERGLARTARTKPGAVFLVAGAILAGVAALAVFYQTTDGPNQRPILDVKSVAVLPFRHLGQQSDMEYLGLGLTDALITRLGNLRQITVRPTGAVMKYEGAERDYARIGRELGVDAVLDGSIQRDGGRVRVTVQLLRIRDGTPIWASTFDEAFTSIFVVQDSISSQMVRALTLELSTDEKRRLAEPDTTSPEAYEAYLKGRFFWSKRTEAGLNKAIEHFERAIQLDSRYARAYAGMAQCYAIYNVYCVTRLPEAHPRARVAAEKALEIDDELAEAHTALALVKEQYEYDWPGAEREFKRALEIDPNSATAHHWYSEYLAFRNRMDESLAHIRRAHELDPVSLIITTQQGYPYLCARQPDLAIPEFEKALALDPNFAPALLFLGQAHTQKAQYDKAIATYRRAIELTGMSTALAGRLGYAYAALGRRDEALKIVREMESGGHASPYDMAGVYAGLGDAERALDLIGKAYEARDDRLVLLGSDGRFDALRSDPRFVNVLRRVGFE